MLGGGGGAKRTKKEGDPTPTGPPSPGGPMSIHGHISIFILRPFIASFLPSLLRYRGSTVDARERMYRESKGFPSTLWMKTMSESAAAALPLAAEENFSGKCITQNRAAPLQLNLSRKKVLPLDESDFSFLPMNIAFAASRGAGG